MPFRRVLSICIGAGLMTRAWAVQAQPSAAPPAGGLPLDFSWTAPDTCPSRADVLEQLSKAVDPKGKELPPLSAQAVVQQDGARWRLELTTELDGRKGVRQLESDSCDALARAASLVLALTLGEGLARRQAEAEAAAAKPPPAPAAPPPPPPPPAKPPAAEPRRTPLSLWLAATAGADPLGAFSPGVALGFGFQPSLLRLGARVEATLPRTSELASTGQVQGGTFGGAIEACVAPALPPLQFTACADGGITLLVVEGQGTAEDAQASVPLYGLGPSVGVQWLLHEHAFLSLGFASRFFLTRPELVVEGAPQTRRVETASVSGALGAGVRW